MLAIHSSELRDHRSVETNPTGGCLLWQLKNWRIKRVVRPGTVLKECSKECLVNKSSGHLEQSRIQESPAAAGAWNASFSFEMGGCVLQRFTRKIQGF